MKKLKVAFDLDGTLDRPSLASLAMALLQAGHEVHIISGVFPESGAWQNREAKLAKLGRAGVLVRGTAGTGYGAILHILEAVPDTYPRDYRLADIGLRKGALCEELEIDMIFDDSAHYCEMIPKMDGHVTVLQVK